MAECIPFIAKAGLTASKNMAEFVRFCREELTVFGAHLDFDAPIWDVSGHYSERAVHHRHVLNFTELGPSRNVLGRPMPEPFAGQVKAYIRYQAARQRRSRPPWHYVSAFRELLSAFRDKGRDPDLILLDAHILDHAVQLAAERMSPSFGARAGVYLRFLSNFLRERNMAEHAPFDWRHGQIRPCYSINPVGKEAAEIRAARLPSRDALDALPNAFRMALEPRDVIMTSVMALLVCAPSRVNEVLVLPHDCELSPLTDGNAGYKLRWAGSKGHPDFVKMIPAVMEGVARDAIARLRQHTAEARRIAVWYEQNPGKLYLPEDCSHLRGRDLTYEDIARIIGFSAPSGARLWAAKAGLRLAGRVRSPSGGKPGVFRFADVERAIVALLPAGFPVCDRRTGLTYSRALLVSRRLEFSSAIHKPWRCMLAPVTYGQIQAAFSGKPRVKPVFERLGLSTPEHPIGLRTHQLRHYLNTLAQIGGLSEVDIAAWSGRRDIRQNHAYDHRNPEQLLEQRRARERASSAAVGLTVRINAPVAKSEVGALGLHGHCTDIGFCEHDFSSAPCALFMQCLHCTKHVYIKGHDPAHAERVASRLALGRQCLAKAEEARLMQYDGAAEWAQSHTEAVQRLEQLHAIFNDPSVPEGTVVRLARSGQYSLVEQAMYDHEAASGVQLLPPRKMKVLPRNSKGRPNA